MKNLGNYEILSHVEMPECSMRILRLTETEYVAAHYHQKCSQVYTVLENQVEARVGDRLLRLRPYETVHIEKGTVHSVRAVGGSALLLSLSIPPMDREDMHPWE